MCKCDSQIRLRLLKVMESYFKVILTFGKELIKSNSCCHRTTPLSIWDFRFYNPINQNHFHSTISFDKSKSQKATLITAPIPFKKVIKELRIKIHLHYSGQVRSLLATVMSVNGATCNCPAAHGPGRERGYGRKPYETNLFPIMLATFSSPPFCLSPSLAAFNCRMPTHQQALLSFRVLPPHL